MSRKLRRNAGALLAGVVAIALISPATPVGAHATGQPGPTPGRDIAAIARANGKTEELVKAILADPAAKVDSRNRLYYMDPAPPSSSPPEVTSAAPFPYAQTFLLHSRPSSQRKIYLDFDGETIANTGWNNNNGTPSTFYAEPFSLDNLITFSNAEQDIVQSVWQRVSEDFAPFDVDVTTEDPGFAAIDRSGTADLTYGTRALITDADEIRLSCGCGGVAYVGVFDEPNSHAFYQPAFVFPPSLGDSAKNIAEATSHEIGHNLDLTHDGTGSSGYYSGHGSWAPIMGVGYSKPIVQWSKGEYSGANNAQDDLSIIPLNGASLLADDHGNTATGATSLGPVYTVSVSGIITTDSDLDVFAVSTVGGPASFKGVPAPVSPNLDILLELRDSAGVVVASSDPTSATVTTDTASGLSASISVNLSVGTYYLFVSGVGAGNPASTGYSGYASIGRYNLTGKVTQKGEAR